MRPPYRIFPALPIRQRALNWLDEHPWANLLLCVVTWAAAGVILYIGFIYGER